MQVPPSQKTTSSLLQLAPFPTVSAGLHREAYIISLAGYTRDNTACTKTGDELDLADGPEFATLRTIIENIYYSLFFRRNGPKRKLGQENLGPRELG